MYTTSIDIWGLGCVVAEMIQLCPLFPGNDTTDQLFLILKARGTPTVNDFAQLNSDVDAAVVAQLQREPRAARKWRKLLGAIDISANLERLLNGLLCWNPAGRLSAQLALQEPYFDGIHNLTSEQQAMLGCQLIDSTVSEPVLDGPPADWVQEFAGCASAGNLYYTQLPRPC